MIFAREVLTNYQFSSLESLGRSWSKLGISVQQRAATAYKIVYSVYRVGTIKTISEHVYCSPAVNSTLLRLFFYMKKKSHNSHVQTIFYFHYYNIVYTYLYDYRRYSTVQYLYNIFFFNVKCTSSYRLSSVGRQFLQFVFFILQLVVRFYLFINNGKSVFVKNSCKPNFKPNSAVKLTDFRYTHYLL